MAVVYSKQLLAVHDGGSTSFVVPSGHIGVIRFVTCFNADNLVSKGAQLVLHDSDCTIYQSSVGVQAVQYNDLHVVVNELEQVDAIVEAEVDLTVSGYLLTLP